MSVKEWGLDLVEMAVKCVAEWAEKWVLKLAVEWEYWKDVVFVELLA